MLLVWKGGCAVICQSLTVNGHMRLHKAGASTVRPSLPSMLRLKQLLGVAPLLWHAKESCRNVNVAPVKTKLYMSESPGGGHQDIDWVTLIRAIDRPDTP